jgi:hypothetical protein
MARRFSPYVPTAVGHAALDELERVGWGELAHAYGVGRVESSSSGDVQATLRLLAKPDRDCFADALRGLYSNICHQGTIYEATAHALPFLAAFAAGDVWVGWARAVAVLLGHIAIASSFETADGSSAGSFGEDVADHTRAAFRASATHIKSMVARHPELADLATAIQAVIRADPPKRSHLDRVTELIEAQDSIDDLDGPRLGDAPPGPQQWVKHPKFGVGAVLRREDEKTRVRFKDGTERVIANQFLAAVDSPATD